jgi:hypothetical protein
VAVGTIIIDVMIIGPVDGISAMIVGRRNAMIAEIETLTIVGGHPRVPDGVNRLRQLVADPDLGLLRNRKVQVFETSESTGMNVGKRQLSF